MKPLTFLLGIGAITLSACGVEHGDHGVSHGCSIAAQNSNWSSKGFTIYDDDNRYCPSLEEANTTVYYGGIIQDGGAQNGNLAKIQGYNSDGNSVGSEASDWFESDSFWGWSAQPWGSFTAGTGGDTGRDYPEITVDLIGGGYAWARVQIDYYNGQAD